MNKAQLIRDYASQYPHAPVKVVAHGLAEVGVEVTPQYVSKVISKERRRAENVRLASEAMWGDYQAVITLLNRFGERKTHQLVRNIAASMRQHKLLKERS